MKSLRFLVGLGIFSILLAVATVVANQDTAKRLDFSLSQSGPRPDDVQLAAAEQVGTQMQMVIQAMKDEKPAGLPFHQAVLTIETGTAKEGDFILNLIVFTLEHKSKKSLTSTLTVTFGKAQLQAFEAFAPAQPPTIDQTFKQALDAALAAATPVTGEPIAKISVKQQFAVSKDNKGGLTFKFTAFGSSASVGGSFDKTKTSVNTIELVYSK